ncbi:hypothetical protein ABZ023_18940 [Streptomyces sp. NPDC006367]|uniref:hypothetical protein n=1 Tax=unclassified Streptomyces TaxID=2593676 RepID=UPI0033AFDA1D
MLTSTILATALDAIDWNRPRACAKASGEVLAALAGDREMLTALVCSLIHDADRRQRCETNPLVDRLVLAEDTTGQDRWQLRLHAFPMGELELIPHDHKYPFTVHVLHGGYLHTWNRRTGQTQTGPFTSADLTAGTVTVEGPGSGYLLFHSLVHQTAVLPGSVTLFLRGPARQNRWHSASDLHDPHHDDHGRQIRDDTRYRRSAPMSPARLQARVADLTRLGIITTERPARP